MEKRRLTEKESLALIAEMIQNTKNRTQVGDGNILLIWGYVSVITALLVYAVCMLTSNPLWNFLWWLIPVAGYPIMYKEKRKQNSAPTAKMYVDKISEGIWKIVTFMALAGLVFCLAFMLMGYNCWQLMLIYAFVAMGFGSAIQGIIIRERSLVLGGVFSILAGGFVTCCTICNIPLLMVWILPLYIISFILMMIVPGHVINRKARSLCQKN